MAATSHRVAWLFAMWIGVITLLTGPLRQMRPYVADKSLVDPAEFMRVLHAHRREVHYRPH